MVAHLAGEEVVLLVQERDFFEHIQVEVVLEVGSGRSGGGHVVR